MVEITFGCKLINQNVNAGYNQQPVVLTLQLALTLFIKLQYAVIQIPGFFIHYFIFFQEIKSKLML